MFPYFEQPAIALGPLTVHGFGVLAAVAIVLGYVLALGRMKRWGLQAEIGSAVLLWAVIAGLAGSHLAALALEEPRALLANGFTLFRVGDGMSSFGGIVVGIGAGVWYLAHHGIRGAAMLRYVDAVAYAFPFAWMIGRAGCAIAHDHPGILTNGFLAVRYPGGPRYDAGLLELLAMIPIAAAFVALGRRPRRSGFYLAAFLVAYAPVRFVLDTVRIEARYGGLTVGQYGSVVTGLVGLALAVRLWRTPSRSPAASLPPSA